MVVRQKVGSTGSQVHLHLALAPCTCTSDLRPTLHYFRPRTLKGIIVNIHEVKDGVALMSREYDEQHSMTTLVVKNDELAATSRCIT
jgi:hypothetical protein